MIFKLLGLTLINLITYPLLIVIVGGFLIAGKISFRDFLGKCGYVPLKNSPGKEFIWFHVSSAGEWNTGKVFAKQLSEKTGFPLLITYFNGDLTRLWEKEAIHFPEFHIIFLPIENIFSFWFIHHHYRIRALVILETEIWPSMILFTYWMGKPIFLVNAVLFSRETNNFSRFKIIFSRILSCFSHIFCVSEKSRENFFKLGAVKKNLSVWSNFKYDVFTRLKKSNKKNKTDGIAKKKSFKKSSITGRKDSWAELEWFFAKKKPKNQKIIIFASFHKGEFIKIIPNMKKFFKNDLFINIIAPREIHPKSINFLSNYLTTQGISYIRRSELGESVDQNDVGIPSNLILDSFGELSSLYSLTDLVIMGGSFIPVGGHNFLEAIFFNKKIFIGEFVQHYLDFVDNFIDYIHVTDSDRIAQDTDDFFFYQPQDLKNGAKMIQKFSGSSKKVADIISNRIRVK